METFKKAWVLTYRESILWESLTLEKPFSRGENYYLDGDYVYCYWHECFIGMIGE